MNLSESYLTVQKSIVAFSAKYMREREGKDGRPGCPYVFGTGFVLREDGILVTNRHVVEYFAKLPRAKQAAPEAWPVEALLFDVDRVRGVYQVPLEIMGYAFPTVVPQKGVFYGPQIPDVALVHVRAKNLPAVNIDSSFSPLEGIEVATAGFTMGTDMLMAPGWLHQSCPTLQRGIISAVLPFACERSHGYIINVMVQGGASGSPVFLPDNGKVIGMIYERLLEFNISSKNDVYRQPANFSNVLGPRALTEFLRVLQEAPEFTQPATTPTLDEILAKAKVQNVFERDDYPE